MNFPRSRVASLPWALTLVGFLATQQFAAIPRILCLEWDGHVEIETAVAVNGAHAVADAPNSAPACATDGCGPCTDVLLEMPIQATHRSAGELHAMDAPEQPVSQLAYLPATEIEHPGGPHRLRPRGIPATTSVDGRIPFLLL